MADPFQGLYSDPYAVKRIKKSVELLDAKPGMSVLDVGCYNEFARQFLPKAIEYVGLDAIKGDQIDGGFKLYQKFDRILCLETLEHLLYPRKTLSSIVDHLEKDGILVISLPNEASLFHRARALFGTLDQECFSESGKHIHLPSLWQSRLFLNNYLKIVKESYYINLSINTSRQYSLLRMIPLPPKSILDFLAGKCPSLFARGFIFVCQKKVS